MAKLGRRWRLRTDADRSTLLAVWGLAMKKPGWGRWPCRDPDRWRDSPNRMSGGTDWDSSLAIGPRGIAVVGMSISEAGLPNL